MSNILDSTSDQCNYNAVFYPQPDSNTPLSLGNFDILECCHCISDTTDFYSEGYTYGWPKQINLNRQMIDEVNCLALALVTPETYDRGITH